MSKKLLSVVLAVALVLSTFAVAAFAVGGYGYESEEDAPLYTQAWSLGEPVADGNNYKVDVILDANYGVGPIQFKVIKTVNAGTLTLSSAAINTSVIPEYWLADISFCDSTGVFAIMPAPEVYSGIGAGVAGGKVIATLTYAASADVIATLAIDVADAKNEENIGGTLIAARMSDGNVVTGTALVGQTVSATTNTVNIGVVAADPELVGKEATANGITSEGYVDTTNKYVYGVVEGADPLAFFEATNGGYIEMTANAQGATNGTGAVLTLYKDNTKATVVDTWTLVIFGDATGDGTANALDVGPVMSHAVGTTLIKPNIYAA